MNDELSMLAVLVSVAAGKNTKGSSVCWWHWCLEQQVSRCMEMQKVGTGNVEMKVSHGQSCRLHTSSVG